MSIEQIWGEVEHFSSTAHGNTDYDRDEFFIMAGEGKSLFAPMRYLQKKIDWVKDITSLLKMGFVFDSFELSGNGNFISWYEKQFSKKLSTKEARRISIAYVPNNKLILDQIRLVHKSYEVLANEQILLNGKNLPTQLGEWYAKCIFGLKQVKSTSQRGFDFVMNDGRRVEIQVEWSDVSSPKGVKITKTLVGLSDHCVIIYVAKNFLIREVCFLDSDYIHRKFASKGHAIFLKDSDVSPYFFSKSSKHFDKIINPITFLKYASPMLAMKLSEKLSPDILSQLN